VQFVERLWILSQAVSTVLLPRLSQLSSDEPKRKQLTPLVSRWTFAITLGAATLLAIIAHPLIDVLFGPGYHDAFRPLLILLPGIVAGSASKILANDLAARGRPELNMYTSWIVVIVNIIGNVVLIPIYGLAGAALATTIAYTLNLILRLYIHRQFDNSSWIDSILLKRSDLKGLASLARKTG
jgi:O-antigen/teichoic acid export membrane protein